MKTFFKEVDTSNREAMIRFLTEHFEYDTMNSWNNRRSYANNIKINRLGLSSDQQDALYELMETDEYSDTINQCIEEFTDNHNSLWTAGTNGRSGGYLVLYESMLKTLDYKSRCRSCGQLNFTSIEENSNVCGMCGKPTRFNLTTPIKRLETYPGRGVDMGEDFEDWDNYALKDRVELVQDFDRITDEIIACCLSLAEEFEVVEEIEMVPQMRKVLKEREVN